MKRTKYKLGDCLSMIKNGATIKQREGASGFPITRIETLSHDEFHRDRLGYADIFDVTPYSEYILQEKDILMSHINSRAYLGRCVMYHKENDEVIIHGMNLLRIQTKADILDCTYAYYFFKSPYFKKCVDRRRTDAVNQSSINITNISDIDIDLPSLEEQKRIASVLATLDQKIALNRQINQNLEALAKQLYDYWFVQFDFPDENGKPYKFSGGAMVYNEQLKREIPKGWEVKKVNSVCSFNKRSSNGQYTSPIFYLDTANITDNQIEKLQLLDPNIDEIPSRARRHVVEGDIVYSTVRPNLRHFGLLYNPKNNLIVSTGFATITANWSAFRYYIYQFLKQEEIIDKLHSIAMSAVSSYPSINPSDIQNLDIVIPHDRLIEMYAKSVNAIYASLENNSQENSDLIKQRDELLPLLMNGQVTL